MRGSVLIIDHDQEVAGLVAEILTSAGYVVSELCSPEPGRIREEVARLEPEVVLLDSGDQTGYGRAWIDAAWLHERDRPIAVIMFTAHAWDLVEGQFGRSERSRRAAFEGFVAKPFELDELVDTVARVVLDSKRVVLSDSARLAMSAF
jgi:DNA-binding NtrC family response regulator